MILILFVANYEASQEQVDYNLFHDSKGGLEGTLLKEEPTGQKLRPAEKASVLIRFLGNTTFICSFQLVSVDRDFNSSTECKIDDIVAVKHFKSFLILNAPQLGATTLSVWTTQKTWKTDPTITIKCVDPAYK